MGVCPSTTALEPRGASPDATQHAARFTFNELTQIIIDDASKQALEQAEEIMLRLFEIADDIEVELNKIDEKVARAETRKKSVRRKAA